MKRFLIILVTAVTLLVSQNASAQIAISERSLKLKEVAVLSPAKVWLYADFSRGETQYKIAMASSNQFDDWFWITLGNREQALVCLEALQDLVSTLGRDEEVTIQSMGEDVPFLVRRDITVKKSLWFSQPFKAGHASLSRSAIRVAIAWFDTNFL